MSSSTTVFVDGKPDIVLMPVSNFYSLTIRYTDTEVKFFFDTLKEVKDFAAKINEQIEIVAKMIDPHLDNVSTNRR